METIAINGRIFEFQKTGVGRFCNEVLRELDRISEKGNYLLLLSKGAKDVPPLRNIEVRTIGKHSGIFWEQAELPRYLYRNHLSCLHMSNSLPLCKPDHVLIHDISLKVNKSSSGSFKDRCRIWWPLLQYRTAFRKAKTLFTVSEFQRAEMVREYGVDETRITVVYEGWQHMEDIEEEDAVLDRLGLSPGTYIFAVSTRAKNKNFRWILENAKYNPALQYVIAGKPDSKYFSDETSLEQQENIVTTGYVTDGELKALMKHARAFVYPSLYEGFGIPPLEALSLGTKTIAARASCLPEILGDAVYYIDPYEADVDLEELLGQTVSEPGTILEKYSWEKAAKQIRSGLRGES